MLFTLVLGLAHCKNDDNGGGNGSSDDPTDPSDPSLSAIYIWRTECHVQGNIEGSGAAVNGVSACDTSALTETGRARAKQLCEARFTAVLPDGIQDEPSDAALRHEPLLAVTGIDGSSEANRQAFIPQGDVTKAVKIPSNGNGLASNWEAFLNPLVDIGEAIPHGEGTAGSTVAHYTGLSSGANFALAIFGALVLNCDDWTSSISDASAGRTSGVASGGDSPLGVNRFSEVAGLCDARLEILCITY